MTPNRAASDLPPAEFGEVGLNWEAIALSSQFCFSPEQDTTQRPYPPAERAAAVALFPITGLSGNGIQSVYLTELPPALSDVLIGLIGKEASILTDHSVGSVLQNPMQVENTDLEVWEHHIESKIESDSRIPDTKREALIVARRGQGLFKQRVMDIETRCRITGVMNPIHLHKLLLETRLKRNFPLK